MLGLLESSHHSANRLGGVMPHVPVSDGEVTNADKDLTRIAMFRVETSHKPVLEPRPTVISNPTMHIVDEVAIVAVQHRSLAIPPR